ncbi:MAG: hypothetical protein KC619_03540 [Myxococcales bacterium]|nr:hypothetical protein [Myxococcales bacterium]
MALPNHDGTPGDDADRFADAPSAIGEVRSTTSNVVNGRPRHPDQGALGHTVLQAMRGFGVGLGTGAILAFVVLAIMEEGFGVRAEASLMLWGTGLGGVVGLLPALRIFWPPREQTFVGEDGLARVRGGKTELVCFRDVARTHEVGGSMDGADFFGLVFLSAEGKRLFHIGGSMPKGRAPTHSPSHFADAAKRAFEAHCAST